MDYDLTPVQRDLLASVDKVIEAVGGAERARAVSSGSGYDSILDEQLSSDIDLRNLGLLERTLVAERLAEVGAATTFGLRAVLADAVELVGPLALFDASRAGPVRYGAFASTVVVIDLPGGAIARPTGDPTESARSAFGFPGARLERSNLRDIEPLPDAIRIRSLWKLATAAEIAGNAAAAIAHTAEHLQQREQFGKPLASFQALRHRLADAAATAEATRWLVREAAYFGTPRAIDLATAYAARCAAQLVPELVQMCGARSFTLDFGLHVFTMRLEGLRLELGGADRLAGAVLEHDLAHSDLDA